MDDVDVFCGPPLPSGALERVPPWGILSVAWFGFSCDVNALKNEPMHT